MSLLFVKIQAILKSRHISQAEFSRKIEVSPQRYSKWVHGTGEPGPASLLKMARVLNVTMESLADDLLEPEPPHPHLEPRPHLAAESGPPAYMPTL